MRKKKLQQSKGLEKLKEIQGSELSRNRQASIEGGKERAKEGFWERMFKTCGGIIKQ